MEAVKEKRADLTVTLNPSVTLPTVEVSKEYIVVEERADHEQASA